MTAPMTALRLILAASAATLLMTGAVQAQTVSPAVTAAVADSGRPDADKARDGDRKPGEAVAVSGLKPGQTVAELAPGGGYFTRILAKTVGPKGKIYAVVSAAGLAKRPTSADAVKAIAASNANVVVEADDYATLAGLPEKVDMVWTTENYHDFFNAMDIAAFNKAVFNALKPGGTYYVEDHAAAAGAGVSTTSTLHRIDPAAVTQQVEAAGFKLVTRSDILKHPEDAHVLTSGDPAIRGKTDRLVLVFRKP